MTRKHFQKIAAALAEARRLARITTGNTELADIAANANAQCVATALAESNPNFDRVRFLIEAGVEG